MITREDMVKAVKRQDRKVKQSAKVEATKLIERCSEAVRSGSFTVPNTNVRDDVFSIVSSAFAKEGIQVTREVNEIQSKNKRNPYTRRYATLKLSLLEE